MMHFQKSSKFEGGVEGSGRGQATRFIDFSTCMYSQPKLNLLYHPQQLDAI